MNLSWTGTAQFGKALRELAPDDSRGVLTDMLVYGAEPLERRMSELAPNAPDEPGQVDLKTSIGVQRLAKFRDDDLGDVVLVDGEAAVAVGPSKRAFHGHLQEFGTAPHGDHPGHAAQPFARPAFDETHEEVVQRVGARMADYIRQAGSRSVTSRGV